MEFRPGRTVLREASESLPLSVQRGAISPDASRFCPALCLLTAGDLTTPLAGTDLSEKGPPSFPPHRDVITGTEPCACPCFLAPCAPVRRCVSQTRRCLLERRSGTLSNIRLSLKALNGNGMWPSEQVEHHYGTLRGWALGQAAPYMLGIRSWVKEPAGR